MVTALFVFGGTGVWLAVSDAPTWLWAVWGGALVIDCALIAKRYRLQAAKS